MTHQSDPPPATEAVGQGRLHPLYTFGYSGQLPHRLRALAEHLDAVVVDIRFSPRSRIPGWTGGRLQKLLADRYLHLPALGNRNQGCSVLKIFRVSLRGSEADEAISGLQCGDCFGKMRLAMTYNRRTEQPCWHIAVRALMNAGEGLIRFILAKANSGRDTPD